MTNVTAAGRYQQLEAARSPFLERGRECATLTIPSLLPPDGTNQKLPTPFQALGARGVNNLAAKLLLALLPPNSPFFRMVVDDFTMEKMTQREGMRAQVEKALSKIERTVMSEIETSAIRVPAFEAIKHLINEGNVLCYLPDQGGMKVFRLDRYVVHRDPMGNVLEIITKECVAPITLEENLQKLIATQDNNVGSGSPDKTVDLYTHVRRAKGKWEVYQEIKGIKVPKSAGTYPLARTPWIPLRWAKIDGEDYGRGYIEEYLGDIKSLEGLTKAIVEGAAAASKVIFLVNPNGTTNIKTLAEAPSGAIRAGNKDDVTVIQTEKHADFQIAFKAIEEISARLSYAFMLNSAIQRKGERVTAEEIRIMASDIEDSLGGIYSILSQEFQYPLVTRLIFQLEKTGRLPPLPRDLMKPTITTGLEALGRGHDLNKIQSLLQVIAPLGPEVIAKYVNVSDLISRAGSSLGIDTAGLIRSEEEIQQQMQQQQMLEMAQKLGPQAMKMAGEQAQPGQDSGPQVQPPDPNQQPQQ